MRLLGGRESMGVIKVRPVTHERDRARTARECHEHSRGDHVRGLVGEVHDVGDRVRRLGDARDLEGRDQLGQDFCEGSPQGALFRVIEDVED